MNFFGRLMYCNILSTSPKRMFLTISLPIALWMVWSAFFFPLFLYSPGLDFWEHSASINEWMNNLAAPRNPHLATEDGSARYMPFFYFLTVMAKGLGLTAIQVLQFSAVFNTALLLLGIYLFFRAYYSNAWAPVLGLVVMFSFWGIGWLSSNEYEIRTLFYVTSYPSTFVFALSLICFWVTIRVLRSEGSKVVSYMFLLLAFTVMVPSHPLTAAFSLAGVGALCLVERDVRLSERGLVLLTVFAGSVLSELWPYFSTFRVVFGTGLGAEEYGGRSWLASGFSLDMERARHLLNEHVFYQWTRVLVGLGPALIGLAFMPYYLVRRRHGFILMGFGAMLVPYVSFLVLPIPLGFRFLFYMVFFLHMAIVAYLVEDMPKFLRKEPHESLMTRDIFIGGTTAITIIGLFLGHIAFAAAYFSYTALTKEPVTTVMARLTQHIPKDAIVLAPELLSWPIPTFSGKVVSLFNPNPFVADQHERFDAVDRFFGGPMTNSERLDIIDRYEVTHILLEIEHEAPGLREFVECHGNKTATVMGFSPPLERFTFSTITRLSRPGLQIAVFELERLVGRRSGCYRPRSAAND